MRTVAASPVTWTVIAAVLVVTTFVGRPATHDDVPLDDALATIVERWHENTGVPGVVVSVRRGTDAAWSAAVGVADEGSGVAMDVDLPFPIGSVTKPFVAATVLHLAEEGLIGLDDPLDRYLTASALAEQVTVRQLLSMRSGLPDYSHTPGFIADMEHDLLHDGSLWWATDELLAIAAGAATRPPGGDFSYSNTNYVLLGELIEAVTDGPWWQATDERIMQPLGLADTTFPDVADVPAVAGHADLDQDGLRGSLAGQPYGAIVSFAGAAGALTSTADDLTSFAHGVLGGTHLTPASMDAMTTVDQVSYDREYGLGLVIHRPDLRTEVIGHTGALIGYTSALWHAPEHHLSIAVLVNDRTAQPEDLAELLLRHVVSSDRAAAAG